MCGIFGAIGKGWNLGTMRALTLSNENRGGDSTGFFDSTGKMIKSAVTASEALRQKNISAWLERSEGDTWFCAGHTRLATRGSVNRKNSHPFRYGRIIGAHNGMVDAPSGYIVDSQYLFDTLSKARGDYNVAWGTVCGYWGISWSDGEYFYLQVHNGELHYCYYRGICYYSSSEKHLESCVGYNSEIKALEDGETLRFSQDGTMEVVTPFKSAAPEFWGKKYGCSNTTNWYDSTKGMRKWKSSSDPYDAGNDETSSRWAGSKYAEVTSDAKSYDDEWRSAWAEYSGTSEHDYDCNDQGH